MQNYVDFELSESLKEVGFDDPVMEYWYRDGEFWSEGLFNITNNYNSNYPTDKSLSRPTYDEAANWMREKKGVYVEITMYHYDIGVFEWHWKLINQHTGVIIRQVINHKETFTYSEAQLAGIKEAVNYLKKLEK